MLKHDKRKSEQEASMENALSAAAAYYIVAYSTLGISLFPGYLGTDLYFEFTTLPRWKAEELYFKTGTWTPVPAPLVI